MFLLSNICFILSIFGVDIQWETEIDIVTVLRTNGRSAVVDVTVLGLVGGAPGGETPRVADSFPDVC